MNMKTKGVQFDWLSAAWPGDRLPLAAPPVVSTGRSQIDCGTFDGGGSRKPVLAGAGGPDGTRELGQMSPQT
jgi:hypothetical protein